MVGKLKHASDEWRTTFDAMEDSVMLINLDHRIARVNMATSKMLGLPFKEIIGKQCFRLIHGTDCPIRTCVHQQTMADGKAHSAEISHPGLKKDFLVSTSPILDDSGRVVSSVHVMRDITENKRIAERLRLSEEKYSSVFNNSPDYIYINDVNGAFLDANPAVLKVFDVSLGELKKKSYLDYFAGDNQEELVSLADGLRQGHSVDGLNLKVRNSQGKIVEIEINAVPIFEDGRVASVLSLARDVSERKRMENILRESEDKFRAMFESSRDAIMTLDRQGFLDCNRATLNVFGCSSRDQFIFKHPSELSPPIQPDGKDSMTAAQERIEAAFTTGGQSFEWLHQRIDGTVFPAEVLLSRIEIGGKQALQAIVRDITERKKAEERVRESAERFENIFDSAGDGIMVADIEKKTFLMGNNAICRMLGYSPEEIHNLGVMDIHPEKDIPYVIAQFEKQAKGEIVSARDLPVKRKDGTVLYADINSTIVTSAGKKYLMGFFHDNTERKQAEEELRTTRDYLEKLLAYSNAPVIVWDPARKITRFNRAFERMTGYAVGEVIGRDLEMLFPAESKESSLLEIDRTATGKFWETVEIPIQRKTGEVRWVLWNSANVYGEDGKTLLSTIAQGQDITERKNTEEALRRSEESFRLITENASDFINIINRKGIMLYASPSHQLLGYDLKEIVGKPVLDFVSAVDKEKINSLLQLLIQVEKEDLDRMLKEGNSDRYIYGVDDKSGNIHYLESTTNIVPNNETGDFNILFVSRDVTDRKKAEEALHRSEERLRLISENTSDFITIINETGEFTYASSSYKRLGFKPDELIGNNSLDFIHPEDRDKILPAIMKFIFSPDEELARLKHGKNPERLIYRIIDKYGEIRQLETTADLIEKPDGFNILLISRDITEKKKMEEELLKNEKLQSLAVLSGGIAHDFNNLLAAILGNVSVALNTTDSQSEMHELLKDVETASHRASGLVQQLLTFSRGGTPIKKQMAIGQLIKVDVQMALSGSRVECEYILPENLWPVEVDAGQLGQVVSNLVINAVQAMPEGGKIGVRAKNVRVGKEFGDNLSEGEYVKISFRDSGKGITPENLSKIFDPFFTTRPESSGLGLSAVYSIIKRHEGHITVDSTPGRGATFSVYLPARRENGREEAKPMLEKTNGTKRVLVMDDELMVQKVTGRMLKQIGYEVEFAKDGQEAIEIYQKAGESSHPFAAVIMDLTIPGGMGGKIAVQKLIEIDPQVKVIVSSGYSNDPIMSDPRKYGFRGVIAKPYRFEEMAEVIKQVIGDQ
ncbi:MAG: PAS domain S-box protein [bacterium]|nr:PAS domain S-box protein [bacterium]